MNSMRKYVSGFIVGVFLATGITAYADSLSLVGKRIQSETIIYKDGEYLDKAIAIDGKSYAPIRVIAESAGLDVSYKGGEIYLETKDQTTDEISSSAPQPAQEPVKYKRSLNEINERISQIQYGLTILDDRINSNQKLVEHYEKQLQREDLTDDERSNAEIFLRNATSNLSEYQKAKEERLQELAELEAEKAQLESKQTAP